MRYETNSTEIGIRRWKELMKGARKCNYKQLVARIREEIPSIYAKLALWYYNPYENDCRETKTHFILVHSAIEYFIRK